jgi:hypothetical protein
VPFSGQNTIGDGLELNAASRTQLASAMKTVDIVAEIAMLAADDGNTGK